MPKKVKEKKELTFVEKAGLHKLTLEECTAYYDGVFSGCLVNSLELIIPFLPPSSNKVYFNRTGGGRAKTTPTKKFINDVQLHMVNNYFNEISKLNPCAMYTLNLEIGFSPEELFTKGYPKAISAYRKNDIDNRVKIVKDTVIKLLGIKDDTQVFTGKESKVATSKEEHVKLRLTELNPCWVLDPRLDDQKKAYCLNKCIHFRESGIRSA